MKKIEVDNQTLGEAIIDILKSGQQATFTVKGSSMMPFFKDGKTIVHLIKKDHYQQGDIIFFSYQNRFILHRINRIVKDQFIVSGDNQKAQEVISRNNIYGSVISYQIGNKIISTRSFFYRISYYVWLIVKPLYMWMRRR